MLNNPKATHQGILAAHQASCIQGLRDTGENQPFCVKLLMLHDTTVLDYSGLDVEGLGQIGNGNGQGLYAHNSLGVIPSTRQIVGLFSQILHRRARVSRKETKKQRAARKDRESRLWKQAVMDLPALPPEVLVTDVSDRGSDITEYIAFEMQAGRQFIVRSRHNRVLVDAAGDRQARKLHDQLRSLPAACHYTIERVPARGGGFREARIGLAWQPVILPPPRQARGQHGAEALSLWGVIAREIDAPPGEEPLEWILLSNRPIESAEQALEVVEDYACRWMIEDYHKAMKTGCGIERLQMTTVHGLSNAIALLSVLAVHVPRLRCNARDQQLRQQPARLHEEALKVQLAARHCKHANWRTMTVWEFSIAVAKMGGYMLNPHKRPPGWIILWRGYIRLEDMCQGVRLLGEKSVQT